MIILHKLEMDLTRRGQMERIDAVQGDGNARVLELSLTAAGVAWEIPEDAAVFLRYRKPDGTGGCYDSLPDGSAAWNTEGNVLRITLAPQVLTAVGTVLAQAELVRSGASVATFTVQIVVQENPAEGVVQSEDYVHMLQWMKGEADRLLQEAKEGGEFDGPPGERGPQGEPGLSVYDFAVIYGYTGKEETLANMLITPSLPLAGGTMNGEIAMGNRKITGLGTPEAAEDAATKLYVDRKRMTFLLTVPAVDWSDTVPYTQTIVVDGLLSSDYPRIQPAYTGVEEADRNSWEAFSCISYHLPAAQNLRLYCLEKKPQTDLILMVEVLR